MITIRHIDRIYLKIVLNIILILKYDKQYNKTIGPIKYRIQKGIVTNWS